MSKSDPDLSLVVIAKDEADRIARALCSVPSGCEVLVLDSGSVDDTVKVARAAGARVIRTDWPGFVAQKNRGLELARGTWVLSLDADEWLEPAAWPILRAHMVDSVDGIRLARCSRWQGRPIRHGRWYPDRRVRLVRRERAIWVGEEPVDRLQVNGRVVEVDVDIQHAPYRSFAEHLKTIDRYTATAANSARARGQTATPLDPALHASWHLVDSLVLRRGWRDGWRGIALAGLGAAHTGLKWHRIGW